MYLFLIHLHLCITRNPNYTFSISSQVLNFIGCLPVHFYGNLNLFTISNLNGICLFYVSIHDYLHLLNVLRLFDSKTWCFKEMIFLTVNSRLQIYNSQLKDCVEKIFINMYHLSFILVKFRIIMDLNDVIKVFKGLRNGVYYGGKVRLVHALVMTLLFKSVSKQEIWNIIKLGFEHARNLGLFVFGYKGTVILLEKCFGKRSINSFIAGALFGGLIFGKKTPVNYQIVLYLVSRVLVGLITLLYKRYLRDRWTQTQPPIQRKYAYLFMASLVWGLVMWLFTVDKSTLQASLTSSMQFLYVQSDKALKNWRQLVPFYVPDASNLSKGAAAHRAERSSGAGGRRR